MKLLFPSPDQVVSFKEFCVDCNNETEHHAFMEQYHAVAHRISFTYHCSVCYAKDPNETMEFPGTYTVYQWNKFLNYNDSLRDN